LGADQARGLRHRARMWAEWRHLVLRYAKIHQSRISTDPTRAVSARYSCYTARNGLPLLSQLCGGGGALQRAEHADLHELPIGGETGQSTAGDVSCELEISLSG